METPKKVCPVVFRLCDGQPEVLAFTHPSAGKQFVKGGIKAGESPVEAAIRELREESGIRASLPLDSLGHFPIGETRTRWLFFAGKVPDLPDSWRHQTEDDFGHTFAFFWHPLSQPLNLDWHSVFHEAFAFFAPRLLAKRPQNLRS